MIARETFDRLSRHHETLDAAYLRRNVQMTRWWFLLFHLLFAAWLILGETHVFGSLLVWGVLQFGVHGGFHRYFSHRSFKTHPWFEFVLACLGCLAFQQGPIWWASVHRHHHRSADTDDDFHSPRQGFWNAHIGWLLRPAAREEINWDLVPDLRRPIPLWVQCHQDAVRVSYAVALLLASGWSGIFNYWIVPVVLCWHTTLATNSFCHAFGSQPAPCPPRGSCNARNNAIVALLNLGEGWHNNHHAHPGYAHHGFHRWYELDAVYVVLFVLEKLGIVWDVKKGFQK